MGCLTGRALASLETVGEFHGNSLREFGGARIFNLRGVSTPRRLGGFSAAARFLLCVVRIFNLRGVSTPHHVGDFSSAARLALVSRDFNLDFKAASAHGGGAGKDSGFGGAFPCFIITGACCIGYRGFLQGSPHVHTHVHKHIHMHASLLFRYLSNTVPLSRQSLGQFLAFLPRQSFAAHGSPSRGSTAVPASCDQLFPCASAEAVRAMMKADYALRVRAVLNVKINRLRFLFACTLCTKLCTYPCWRWRIETFVQCVHACARQQ